MTESETLIQSLNDLAATCAPDHLTEIDFDRLRETLDLQRRFLIEHEIVQQDLAALRQDYIDRITGMVKAIAAVTKFGGATRSGDALKAALEYVQSLETKSATELIEHYRLTTARFRDAFPTSFGHLRTGETVH